MSIESDPVQLEKFLHEMCDAAEVETLKHFRAGVSVDNKLSEDFDPVTEADRAAERAIRTVIENKFADHGIIGEEYGAQNPDSRWQWIIDPIDGTRAYICGLPLWGTLIGLYVDGRPIAGVMAQPFTGERYICNGMVSKLIHGATETVLKVSNTKELGSAKLMTTSPALFLGDERAAYDNLEAKCRLPRFGTDCYAYALLAAGQVDLVLESGLHIYDIAALIPLIEKAGGLVTDWEGGDCSKGGKILAAATPKLHRAAMDALIIS